MILPKVGNIPFSSFGIFEKAEYILTFCPAFRQKKVEKGGFIPLFVQQDLRSLLSHATLSKLFC